MKYSDFQMSKIDSIPPGFLPPKKNHAYRA
jgi:hypothetical protein